MNGPYDRYDPGLDGNGLRNARSNRLHAREQGSNRGGGRGGGGEGEGAMNGTQQSSLLAGRGGRDNRNDPFLYDEDASVPENRGLYSSLHPQGPGDDSLRGQRPPRSISPDSLGNGIANDPLLTGQPPAVVKAPPKGVPGAYAATSSSSSSSSSGGPFGASHDAIAEKVAAYDTASAASRRMARIEIAPGVTARLRGADETWAALENDYYLPASCVCCGADICCIMDADVVLCPLCKVVSPMDGCAGPGFDGGVGLGFTFDDLQTWQEEIIYRRRRLQQQQQQQQQQRQRNYHQTHGW